MRGRSARWPPPSVVRAEEALARRLSAPREMPAVVRAEEASILGMHDPAGFQAAARDSR